MKETNNVKEIIIRTATELIQEYNGNVAKITLRKISERANVGLGLINYHFGSKEQLITICVQRIINNVVTCFSPSKKEYNKEPKVADKERLADWAKQVYDFLFNNQAISSISILGDMQNYQLDSNSVYTQEGFSLAIKNDMEDRIRKLLIFVLTSTMQVAFLSRDVSEEMLGYNLKIKEERDAYIDSLVGLLFTGVFGMEES